MASPTEWYNGNFFVSTKPSLIQPDAVNAAFGSESMYWTKQFKDESLLKAMPDNSLCFGVYDLPKSSSEIAGRENPRQIGLARLITDKVTFSYLTDVYIVEEHQGKGLGTWLIECVNESISGWPELRRIVLITGGASKVYEQKSGMKNFDQGNEGRFIMSRKGPGSVLQD